MYLDQWTNNCVSGILTNWVCSVYTGRISTSGGCSGRTRGYTIFYQPEQKNSQKLPVNPIIMNTNPPRPFRSPRPPPTVPPLGVSISKKTEGSTVTSSILASFTRGGGGLQPVSLSVFRIAVSPIPLLIPDILRVMCVPSCALHLRLFRVG